MLNKLAAHLRLTVPVIGVAVGALSLSGQEPARWSALPKPTLTILTVPRDSAYALSGITDAIRLPGGMIAVANGKPREILLFDGRGRFVRRVGRSGEGPGEFKGELRLVPGGPDSVTVVDWSRQTRVAYSVRDASFSESAIAEMVPPSVVGPTLRSGALLRFDLGRATGCPSVALGSSSSAPTQLREVFVDATGRSWIRGYAESEWHIFSSQGRPLASTSLPSSFQPFHFQDGSLVGGTRTKDGSDQVVVIQVRGSGKATPDRCLTATDSFPAAGGQRTAALKSAMRNAAVANESAKQKYQHHVSTLDSLGISIAQGMTYRGVRATSDGWAAMVVDNQSRIFCFMAVGDAAPVGWRSGMLACGN